MKLFNTLALEISAQCNRRCAFCPVAYNARPRELMDAALFAKAVAELNTLRYRGRVELYIYNEPTADMTWLLACLLALRSAVPRACLMVATNGDYLRRPENIAALYEAGLNQLLINCYSPGLYERRKPWLAIHRESGIEIGGPIYSYVAPYRRTLQMLDKSDATQFGTGVFRIINRAGNIPAFAPATAQPVQRMCVKPFRLLNINWTGQALLCCNDYHGALNFGSLHTSTLVQLWNHPVLNTYRRQLLRKDRSLPLCRSCDCHAGAYPANVPRPTGKFATFDYVNRCYKEVKNAK